jgi:uncharacterized pyridoxal phosphate-dependent enzyme
MLNRKQMLKLLATIPVVGSMAGSNLIRTVGGSKLHRPTYKRDFITELGLRPFINARGTFTVLTGSLMEEEVLEAINFMAQQYVNINDLQDRVGERMAEMLNCEAAMVTAGAASALTLGTAAAITGDDQDLIRELPNLPGPQKEVIIQSTHRFAYDHAVRNCGVKMVEVDSPRDMRRKINENTVLALFFNAANEHLIGKEEFVEIGKRYNIPTFNDAAADVPPKENLFRYIEMGFDLVTFSGGKAIRGPQSAGLLYGRKDLIEAAKLNHNPNANTIGRGMKVNKEEIVGMMVALEVYLSKDHEKEWQEWLRRVDVINRQAAAVPTVVAEKHIPEGPSNLFPGCKISWDEDHIPVTPGELAEVLRYGHPSIETAPGRESLDINVSMMRSKEAGIVGRRIREELELAMKNNE